MKIQRLNYMRKANMNFSLPVAIIISSLILGGSYFLSNLYKLEVVRADVVRINTLTGTVTVCEDGVCK